MPTLPVRVVLYESAKDNLPKPVEFSWEEFAAQLLEHEMTECVPCPGKACALKNGLAWSGVIIAPGRKRANENVQGVSLAAFDLDHLTTGRLEALAGRLEGLECVLHSTHNHRPPNDLALRLVFPLSRVLMPKEWAPLRAEVIRRYEIPADPSAKDLARLFFFPTAPAGSETLAVRGEGDVLNVDELLASAQRWAGGQVGKPRTEGPPPLPTSMKNPGEVDMSKLHALMREYDPNDDEKREIIRKVRKGETLAEEGARDNTVHRAACILACLFPSDTPKEVVMEILRPSVASLPGDEGAEYWLEKASFSYDRAFEGRLKRDASNRELRQQIQERFGVKKAKIYSETISKSDADPASPAPEENVTDDDEEEEDPEAWKGLLRSKFDKREGFVKLENIGANVGVIIEHSPEWKNVLHFNELTKGVELHGGPLAKNEQSPSQIGVAVNNWLARSLWDLRVSNQEVAAQVHHVARRHGFNPVSEYLLSLKWDGEKRNDSFLERYFGAIVTDPRVGNITEYIRSISAKWLISAVARALKPGCKVDTVLVLEGLQGIKKSTAFKILGGSWFADSQLRLDDKDSKMLAAQSWIIELAELVSLRKSESESHKSFLTSRVDKFRPPYGATVEEFPRRCVFVGTTNESRYLIDLTGNRRFWPVLCGDFDLEALDRERDQIWAEAVVRYQAGERWWFSPEEQELADRQTAGRMKAPAKAEAIWAWWTRLPKEKRPTFALTLDIAVNALNVSAGHIDERLTDDIDRAMRYLGFAQQQVKENEQTVTAWVATEKLRNVERGTTRRDYLRLISNATVTKHDDSAGEG
jgi:predicted P-loop ATPase